MIQDLQNSEGQAQSPTLPATSTLEAVQSFTNHSLTVTLAPALVNKPRGAVKKQGLTVKRHEGTFWTPGPHCSLS